MVVKKPTRHRKKRPAATDASGSTHPPKKLREDYGTSSGAATGGKSPYVIKELLERSVLNAEIGVAAIETLPFVTSSVSATPEREVGDFTNVITGPNLRTIGPSESAASAPSISVLKTDVDPIPHVGPHTFLDSCFTHTARPNVARSSQRPGKELSIGSRELDSETLQEVFVLRWNVPNDILAMDYHQLFTEYNVETTRQAFLNVKVRMRTKYSLSERKRMENECEKQTFLLQSKDGEIERLKAQLLLKEVEAAEAVRLRTQVVTAETTEKVHADESSLSVKDLEVKDLTATVTFVKFQNDSLVDQVHALEATCSGLHDQVSGYEHLKEQFEEIQDAQMNTLCDKMAKLEVNLIEMALHLEEKFYPHLLTYLSALGTAISCAIEKGMQDGLSAGIEHGKEGRDLKDLVAYNPAMEADYNSALQDLRAVDFPVLAELKSQTDAILGATSLSFALSVSHDRVERIRQNVAEHRSTLVGVYVPLVNPLCIQSLTGATGPSDALSIAVGTTTALSTTFASTSSIPPVSVDDYVIANVDDEEDIQPKVQERNQDKGEGSVASTLEIEFEKEELDTTP
ncbi:hypothetical protein Tco_1071384 [Tanacetum coccineum]